MTNNFKIVAIFLIVFQAVSSFGQHVNPVAQRVEQFKQHGGSFKRTTLTVIDGASQGRTDGSLFQLDKNQLMELSRSESPLEIGFPDGKNGSLTVELIPYEIVTDNFVLKQGDAIVTPTFKPGKHYRGIVQNDNTSQVAVSIFENELRGMIQTASGSFSIEKAAEGSDVYNVKNARQAGDNTKLVCGTKDDGKAYTAEQLSSPFGKKNSRVSVQNVLDNTVVRVYVEVEASVTNYFADIQSTVNYTTSLFNESFLIFQNENINMQLSEIVVWESNTTPYTAGGSLSTFASRTDEINGDIGNLLYVGPMGVANSFSALCHPNVDAKLCISGVSPGSSLISSSVKMVTHEMGHLLGSRHTHACVWNGNATAIDGCSGPEGMCDFVPVPAEGGTIMSYCDNIEFALGFGEQPGNVIRNNVIGAQCLNATPPSTTVYCTSQGLDVNGTYIDRVAINGTMNASAKRPDSGYSDFTTLPPVRLTAGATSSLMLRSRNFISNAFIPPWEVWIDYNRNNMFDANEQLSSFSTHFPTSRQTDATFVVPQWAYPGFTRMRVLYSPYDYTNPCEIFERGEVEDYSVEIVNENLNYGDPGAMLVNKAVAPDRRAGDSYGFSVSVSGNYAIATAPRKDQGKGAAYILKKDADGRWIQHQVITASDGISGDFFGYAAAIKDDVILVGAPYDDALAGAVYVFRKNEQTGNWQQTQKLTGADRLAAMYFGTSVSMTTDVAVVGANGTSSTAGAAYIFTASENTWAQAQKLQSPDGKPGARFGTSVAISESATNIVVGAMREDTNVDGESPLAGAGGVYIFTKSESSWIFKQKLVSPARSAQDYFGAAVGITDKFIAIGANGRDANGIKNSGAVYVFLNSVRNIWQYDGLIISADPRAEDAFGKSVSISGDYILAGVANDDYDWTKSVITSADAGAAYLFKRDVYLKKWTPTKKITAPDRMPYDLFGSSVAMEKDQIVIGSINTDIFDASIVPNSGGAYFYTIENYSEPTVETSVFFGAALDSQLGASCDIVDNRAISSALGISGTRPGLLYFFEKYGTAGWRIKQEVEVPSSTIPVGRGIRAFVSMVDANTAVAGMYAEGVNGLDRAGAVYTYSYTNGQWVQGQRLTAPTPTASEVFGVTISAKGDEMIVGDSRRIHFYQRTNGNWVIAGDAFTTSGRIVDIANGIVLILQPIAAGQAEVVVFRKGVSPSNPSVPWWNLSERISESDNEDFKSIAISAEGQVLIGYKSTLSPIGKVYNYNCGTMPCRKVSTLEPPSELSLGDISSAVKISGNTALVEDFTNDIASILTYEKNENGVWNYNNRVMVSTSYRSHRKLAISGSTAMIGYMEDQVDYWGTFGSVSFFHLLPRAQELNELAFNLEKTSDEQWAYVYPNPAENVLHLDVTLKKNEHAQVQIFSATGNVRFAADYLGSQQVTINDFASYSPGIYLVKITTPKRSSIIKIIKN